MGPCGSEVVPHAELGQGWALPADCAAALNLRRASPELGARGMEGQRKVGLSVVRSERFQQLDDILNFRDQGA